MCSVRGSDSGAEAHSGDSAHLPAPVDALGPPEDTSCPSPGPEGSTPGPRSLTVCLWGSSLRTSFPGEAARPPWFSTCDRDVLSLADSNSAVGPGVMCPLGVWSVVPVPRLHPTQTLRVGEGGRGCDTPGPKCVPTPPALLDHVAPG